MRVSEIQPAGFNNRPAMKNGGVTRMNLISSNSGDSFTKSTVSFKAADRTIEDLVVGLGKAGLVSEKFFEKTDALSPYLPLGTEVNIKAIPHETGGQCLHFLFSNGEARTHKASIIVKDGVVIDGGNQEDINNVLIGIYNAAKAKLNEIEAN